MYELFAIESMITYQTFFRADSNRVLQGLTVEFVDNSIQISPGKAVVGGCLVEIIETIQIDWSYSPDETIVLL